MRKLALCAILWTACLAPGEAAEKPAIERLVTLISSGYESSNVDMYSSYRNKVNVEISMAGAQVSVSYEKPGSKIAPRAPLLKIVVDRYGGHALDRFVVEDEDADGVIDVGYAIHQPPYPAVRPDDFYIRHKNRCLYRKHRPLCGPQGSEREAAWQKKYDEMVASILERLSK